MKRIATVFSALALLCLVACGASPRSASGLSADPSPPGAYPLNPDLSITPGVLCSSSNSDAQRYPEHIAYCNRGVSSDTKRGVIQTYDSQLGYRIGQMDRADFKIDHFIPLCMGGANDRGNLWPQNREVYSQTDPIEEKLCQLMAAGKRKQVDAVDQIKHVKFHLDEAAAMVARLDAELH